MKQITINTYKYKELSDEAKETARNELCDINVDHEWYDCTYDDAKEIGLVINKFDFE